MIWALHGFLGRSSDWDILQLPKRAPDLFASRGAVTRLFDWTKRFCQEVADVDPEPTLIGYSLGGRLALHTLVYNPGLFRRAVIISAHTGLATVEERLQRLSHDDLWAERFETDGWNTVIHDWDAQSVFGGRPNPNPRKECDFSRAALAQSLRAWSLGQQENLLPAFHWVQCPVLWVVGAEDTRYREIGERAVAQLPNADLWVCPDACHRVPWENPEAFRERIIPFLGLDY
jgi:2-succinyl-6-hydroxy-2,4-cyclohexadiene-1-carboxylate synthase